MIIDRAENPHIAFGVGIHRCAGSNLARMEMQVSIEEWLKRIPDFRLEDPDAVTWAGGQVRGPRTMPVVFAVMRIRVDGEKCQGHNRCFVVAPRAVRAGRLRLRPRGERRRRAAGAGREGPARGRQLPRARHQHRRDRGGVRDGVWRQSGEAESPEVRRLRSLTAGYFSRSSRRL